MERHSGKVFFVDVDGHYRNVTAANVMRVEPAPGGSGCVLVMKDLSRLCAAVPADGMRRCVAEATGRPIQSATELTFKCGGIMAHLARLAESDERVAAILKSNPVTPQIIEDEWELARVTLDNVYAAFEVQKTNGR